MPRTAASQLVAHGAGYRRRDDIDLVVVDHDRNAIIRAQLGEEERCGLAGRLELPPEHRAGAVEHEFEVQRQARQRVAGRRLQVQEEADAVTAVGGAVVVEGEAGVHGGSSGLWGGGGRAGVGMQDRAYV